MNWASDENVDLPDFKEIAIAKNTVSNAEAFAEYVSLCDLKIISEEPEYYILSGTSENLESFAEYWSM